MKQRIIGLALAAGCIVLGVFAFFLYMGQDRKAPEISVKKMDITYNEGDNYDSLLKGVTAKDNIDGDLTDKVFVDKIVQTEDGKAVVYYGVMDSNNNVSTAKRKITYHSNTQQDTKEEDEQEKETEPQEPAETDEPQPAETEEELVPDGARPAIALVSDSTTITAGGQFDPMSMVKGAVDDKDDYDFLSRHIHADGDYNTAVPGTYTINYYVSDSEGNTSDVKTFTLTVQ